MKKIFAVILTAVMFASLALSGFAASFVSSPSSNAAPTLDSFDFEDASCVADIIITPYSKRDTLTTEKKTAIEAAYNEIKATNDVSALNADLAALAKTKGINGKYLAVSDLFDVSAVGCDVHNEHGRVTIKLTAETLSKFVGLLQYKDGEWELVTGASVSGKKLTFTVDELSSFAVVVNATPDAPPTGDNGIYILIAVAIASLVAAVICFNKAKEKAKAN